MSDGPSKAVPGAAPLDDIILGEDEPRTDPPPPPARPSAPPVARSVSQRPERPSTPAAAPSTPPGAGAGSSVPSSAHDRASSNRMKRAKMTLRIPDDEVSRPIRPTPSGGTPAAPSDRRLPTDPDEPLTQLFAGTGPPPAFGADDTIEVPPEKAPRAVLSHDIPVAVATGIDATNEPGWTPFQPAVDDDDERTVIQPTPPVIAEAAHLHGHADGQNGGGSLLDAYEPPPLSDEIPVEISDIPDTASDEVATNPRLPSSYDSEEIRIEESDRPSETGEVEVAVEDVMSVESLPAPPPPIKTAGKYTAYRISDSTPPAAHVPATATALMSGAAVAAVPTPSPSRPAGHRPSAPAPSPSSPSLNAPVGVTGSGLDAVPPARASSPDLQRYGSSPSSPSIDVDPMSTAPTPTPPMGVVAQPAPAQAARRAPSASNPLIFVPPVGALAPPPMTDTAAHRKKTRPWWEELFNDDFIRTMAKVTDSQIGKEVNFVEESLGCEAGAMILDLACGTGRHAVELAARGYQVVGFDLSLAMLARASDEAQDRNQKINFVQGDMREMTFEETFDGVYSWNTSFGYFDETQNGSVIARVHKALKKGGQFLLDVVNRDYIVRQAPSLAWFEGDGCICMDEMGIDFITSRMKIKRTLMMDDGRTKEIEYSIRVYALHELGKMLHDNGFRVAEVSGRTGTPGVFFGCESPRTLILAEKR